MHYSQHSAVKVARGKCGFGAASLISFSDDFLSFVGMYDIEKSRKGYERIAVSGGTKKRDTDYGALETAIREADEEMGYLFPPNEPVQIPWKRTFPDGTTHDFFAATLPASTKLRDSGTFEEVGEEPNKKTILVLGPPRWFSLQKYLRPPNRDGGDPSTELFLHFSHLQGICEALMFLYAKKEMLVESFPKFGDAWNVIGPQVIDLRSRWARLRA